jgi:hypothetical protein
MSHSLDAAMSILGYNGWLFQTAVKDVGDSEASYRVNDRTNSFDRLAGHVTVCRHGTAGLLGIAVPDLPWGPFAEFGVGTQFDPERPCPSINDIVSAFDSVTAKLMAGITNVPDEVLDAPSPFEIPGEDPTVRDLRA